MIPQKVKDHIEEYISQEVYVQIAIIKGKEKISTESAIDRYFNTNHFRDFSEGKPYFHFIDGAWLFIAGASPDKVSAYSDAYR